MLSKKTLAKAMCGLLSLSCIPFANVATPVKAASKTKLVVWLWGGASDKPTTDLFKKVATDFDKANKNVTVDVSVTENEAYKTKIATAMASGQMPDVFETWPAGKLKEFVSAKKVYSLSGDFAKDSTWKKKYPSSMFDPLTFGGKIYAIPNTHYITPLIYNKALFKKYKVAVPKTYAQLKNAIKVFNKNNVAPIALGEKDAWAGAMLSEVIISRVGGNQPIENVRDNKGKKWADPAFKKAGDIVQDLVKANAFEKGFMSTSYDDANSLFKRGKAAMLVMGTWVGGMFSAKDSAIKNSIGVAKFPTVDNGKGSTDLWIGSPDCCLAISNTCKNKAVAVKLLKMYAQPKYQIELAEKSGSMPASVVKVNPAKANDVMASSLDLEKTMKGMCPAYDVELGSDLGNEFNTVMQSIFGGTKPAEAFKTMQKYADGLKK